MTSLVAANSEDVVEEACRLDALNRLDFLDTPREEPFDRVARLVRNIFDVPFAVVTGIDAHRQWYKASEGTSALEVPRSNSFCRYILADQRPLVVEDALLDPRFSANPYVVGEPHVRFYAGVPLTTRDGHVIGSVCAFDTRVRSFDERAMEILVDLGRIVMEALELRHTAATDVLTGTMSRRAFLDRGAALLKQAAEQGAPLSCVSFDLDHFKRVNDTLGHAAGDHVLERVAGICRARLRKPDLFGRLGGEEFALLLPGSDRAAAIAIADRLRQTIGDSAFPAIGGGRVTASFGVACMEAGGDLHALLAEADAALYEAKETGRNRVVAASPRPVGAGAQHRVLKAGLMRLDQAGRTIDCTVRSLGPDGAELLVGDASELPDRFVLSIPADGLERHCLADRLDQRRLAVRFT